MEIKLARTLLGRDSVVLAKAGRYATNILLGAI